MTIQRKVAEHYVSMVLFIMLYKVVLIFQSVDEILNCENSKERCWREVISNGAVCYALQGGFNF